MTPFPTNALVLWVLAACLSLGMAGCCCFGGDWVAPPPTTAAFDDRGAEAEARRYFAENADALVAQLTDDAGPDGADCVSGLGSLATTAVVVVASHGHAGGDPAAQVSISPGRCFVGVLVLVVLTGGAWHAVSIVGDTFDSRVTRLGVEPEYIEDGSYGGGTGDSNWGSDELF